MSLRNFDSHLGGDLLAMGFDVVLALDTHSSRKSTEEPASLEISSNSPPVNNLGYGDMLLHRFEEDLNEGDIAQLTDLTYSLPKGDSESAQSFLAKIACQDLARELGSTQISPQKAIEAGLFNSVSDSTDDHSNENTNGPSLKTPLQPVDVYGRVSLYEGKLILQLKHFNANTSYPLNVGECWLCREKMSNGSQIHSHKHALQGLFQVNDEFVQMDIDHYIIPDQALDPDPPPDVNKNLIENSLINNVNHSTIEHINDCRSLPLEDIKCSQSLSVNLDTIGDTLQNSDSSSLINNTGELDNTKQHDLQYSAAEFHNALNTTQQPLNSDVPLNSNSFLNTFTNTDLRMEPVVSTDIVETPNDSIIINHVTDTLSPTTVNPFASSAISLSSCNNSNNINTTATLISKTCMTETHSTQTDMTNIQDLCTSNSDPRGEDTFIQHTTYEPNIGNKDQLENYQSFFGNSYSYTYESNELSSHLPKITTNAEQNLGSVALCDENQINQSSSLSKCTAEMKKIEVGAKKRKSKVQKKTNRILMKDDNIPFCNTNSTKEIFFTNSVDESVNDVNISKNKSIVSVPKVTSEVTTVNSGNDTLKTIVPVRNSLKDKISCPFCSECFPSGKIQNFKEHLKIHKYDDSFVFTCPVCSEKVPDSVKFIKHIRTHIGKRLFCTKCDANYSRSDKLKNHIMNVHGTKKKLVCEFCSKSFTRLEYLKQHKNIHLGNKFECDICHKFYSSLFNLQYHKKSHDTEKIPYQCTHCEKAYLRKDLLQHHTVKEHKNKRYKCDICSKMYSRKDVLRRHKETHDDKRASFNCDVCDKKFYRKDSLKAHSYKHKESKNTEIAKDKSKSKKPRAKDVLLRTEKPQKEQCNICLKYLPSSLRLEKHLQWHQNQLKLKAYFERECIKTFKCDTCSRSFRTKELMKRHILRSHQIKSDQLPSHSSILKEPVKIESEKKVNNKKFLCEICSKGFTRNSNLKVHMETHLKKDADDDNILAEIPNVLKACRSNSLKELITSESCSSPVINGVSKENASNVSSLHLLLDGNLVTPNSSFSSSFPADLPTTFCSSPSSPMNLSTEAMGAAAYLLTNTFYEGGYH
ncbi:UNVERIFIED_CONTAM: hypothetical protein RMT77_006730 [Armadillidium vulgare]